MHIVSMITYRVDVCRSGPIGTSLLAFEPRRHLVSALSGRGARRPIGASLLRFEPRRHLVLAVAANVGLNDDDGKEHGQRDEDHVHTKVRTCRTRDTAESRQSSTSTRRQHSRHSVHSLTAIKSSQGILGNGAYCAQDALSRALYAPQAGK